MLIESFPFGRRAFRFELDAADRGGAGGDAARRDRSPRCATCWSPRTTRRATAEIVATVRARFRPRCWCMATAALVAARGELPRRRRDRRPAALHRLCHGAGVHAPHRRDDAGAGEVLVSAGGGAVGGPLFRAALAARPLYVAARQAPWRLLAGPQSAASGFAALPALRHDGVDPRTLPRRFPAPAATLPRCRSARRGYNTTSTSSQRGGARRRRAVRRRGRDRAGDEGADAGAERGLVHVVDAEQRSTAQRAAGDRPARSTAPLAAPAPACATAARSMAPAGAAECVAEFACQGAWPMKSSISKSRHAWEQCTVTLAILPP